MDIDIMLHTFIRRIIEARIDAIDLAYNLPGGIEGWFQVELFKMLYDQNKAISTEITREKPYPKGGALCDFYWRYFDGRSVWVELKVDENNRLNYAQALESDIQKLNRLNVPNASKYAVLISKNTYIGSEISAFEFDRIRTVKGNYNVWVIICD